MICGSCSAVHTASFPQHFCFFEMSIYVEHGNPAPRLLEVKKRTYQEMTKHQNIIPNGYRGEVYVIGEGEKGDREGEFVAIDLVDKAATQYYIADDFSSIEIAGNTKVANAAEVLRNAVGAIGTAITNNMPVYVNCAAGLKRSVAVAAAYLLHAFPEQFPNDRVGDGRRATGTSKADKALAHVQAKRRVVTGNVPGDANFMGAMVKHIFDKEDTEHYMYGPNSPLGVSPPI